MNKFKRGDKVRIACENSARDVCANVKMGDIGIITKIYDDGFVGFLPKGNKRGWYWDIPSDSLELIKEEV